MRVLSLLFAVLAVTNTVPLRAETNAVTTNAVTARTTVKPLTVKPLAASGSGPQRGFVITGKRVK